MARKVVEPDRSAQKTEILTKGKGEKVKEKEILLASFGRQLNVVRGSGLLQLEYLEYLGRKMAESFTVELRVRLASPDNPRVDLPAVGTLRREGETEYVSFQPNEVLSKDAEQGKLRLGEFFDKQGGPSHLRGESTWHPVFQKFLEPYWGLDLLSCLGSEFLRFLMVEDQRLENASLHVLLEAMCLGVHDAICCGAGIVLETVGTFYPHPSLSFKPDDILLDTIRSVRASTRTNPGNSNLKISELRVGPSPKI